MRPGDSDDTNCTPGDGSYAAFFGSPAGGGIEQTVTGITSGDFYTVDFWVENAPITDSAGFSIDPSSLALSWDGTVDYSITDPATAWQMVSVENLVASGTSAVLSFNAMDVNNWVGLDDITVTAQPGYEGATPEPVSTSLAALGLLLMAGVRARRSRARA